jgi:hypothetical protein
MEPPAQATLVETGAPAAKPSRRRPVKRAPVVAEEGAEGTAERSAESTAAAPAPVEETTPDPVPVAEAIAPQSDLTSNAEEVVAPPGATDAAAPKPKSTRSRSKKAVPVVEAEAAAAAAETDLPEAPGVVAAETVEASASPLVENPVEVAPAPAPKPSRSRSKKATAPAPAAEVEPSAMETAPPAPPQPVETTGAVAPAKRTRKSAAKKGAESAPAPQADAQTESESDFGAEPEIINDAFHAPQIGVEIVESEVRNGQQVHTIRDLRNGNTVRNVSRKGARDLWSYAITRHEDSPVDPATVNWIGNIGLLHVERRAGKVRYDLALREGKRIRVFYGVTADGMEGRWSTFLQEDAA